LLLANDLPDVEFLEFALLREGFVALRVELDTHAIGSLFLDHFANEIRRLSRDMCRAHDQEFAAVHALDVDVRPVVPLTGIGRLCSGRIADGDSSLALATDRGSSRCGVDQA